MVTELQVDSALSCSEGYLFKPYSNLICCNNLSVDVGTPGYWSICHSLAAFMLKAFHSI